jgi:hypothetical protein
MSKEVLVITHNNGRDSLILTKWNPSFRLIKIPHTLGGFGVLYVNYFPGDATVNAKCYSNLLKGRLQNAPRTMVLRPVDTTTLFNFYISFLSPHYFIFIRIKEDIGVHTFSEMRIDVC